MKGADEAAKTVSETNRIYSSRVLARMTGDPGPMHSFAGAFDETVFSLETQTEAAGLFNKAKTDLSNNSIQYRLPGGINGHTGV